MHLRDLKLRAMDGSVLVDGELAIISDDPAAARLPSSVGRLVGVNLRQGSLGASFHLYQQTASAADGFYAASPPILSLRVKDGLPDLGGLFPQSAKRHQRLESQHARLATIGVKFPRHEGDLRELTGRINDLTVAIEVEAEGLRLNLDGVVGPMQFHDEATPRISQARVVGRLLIPRAYCALQGFSLGWRSQTDPPVGAWAPWGPGLGAAPMSVYGTPYCPGRLTWAVPPGARAAPTGHVALNLHEHRLIAKPVGAIDLLASGFAAEHSYFADGPELELGMGFAEWTRMLETQDEAEMEWRGVGLGHVDGQTGRSVGECGGPMRQLITRLQLHLKRCADGLQVRGEGELLPLAGEGARSLGPELAFDFLLPRGWILARGLNLPRFWQDWRKKFPNETAW
jgi:hypothetical protein